MISSSESQQTALGSGIDPAEQKSRIERDFLPQVIKPGRYAGIEWARSACLESSGAIATVIHGRSYESAVNNPLSVELAAGLRKRFAEVGVFYALARDAQELLQELSLPPFSSPGYTPLSSSALLIAPLQRYSDVFSLVNQLSLAEIPISRKLRHSACHSAHHSENTKPALIAVLAPSLTSAVPPLLNEIFDRVLTLKQFSAALNSVATADQLRELLLGADEICDGAVGSAIFPQSPLAVICESAVDRARFAVTGDNQAPDSQSLGDQLVSAIQKSGLTEFQLESLSQSGNAFSLTETLEIVANKLTPQRLGVALLDVPVDQLSERLAGILSRFRRTRLELTLPTLSYSVAAKLGEKVSLSALEKRLKPLCGAEKLSLQLSVGLGYTPDDDNEVNETIDYLRTLSRSVDKRRGLRLRFNCRFPADGGSVIASVATIREQVERIKRGTRSRGVSFTLADPTISSLDTLLERQAWSSVEEIETCARRMKEATNAEDNLEALPDFPTVKNTEELWITSPHSSKQERTEPTKESDASGSTDEGDIGNQASVPLVTSGFGRQKKRLQSNKVGAPTKTRIRFTWRKGPLARFTSHLDCLRVIEGAILRSGVPISYTQSANPRLKLSFGPPLPLGFTSESELFDASFETPLDSSQALRLQESPPAGFAIENSELVYTKSGSIQEEVKAATYLIELPALKELSEISERLRQTLLANSLDFVRQGKRGEKTINLRPGVYAAEIVPPAEETAFSRDVFSRNEQAIKLTLALTDTFYVRPEEYLEFTGLATRQQSRGLKIHRQKLWLQTPSYQRLVEEPNEVSDVG